MQCQNHPAVPAVDRCSGCAEAFCPNCLVEINGTKYCGSCKTMAVQGMPIAAEASITCKEAKSALIYAILGLFCFGIVLGPVAITKGMKAKSLMAENPRLSGSGMANAAIIIGVLALVFWGLGMIARVTGAGQ